MAHTTFPSDLPVPVDDGLASHLSNSTIPSTFALPPCTNPSSPITLSSLKGLTILFIYPRTGAPDEVVPASWNSIPGARGCTPELCSVRDRLDDLYKLGVTNVFGISTQDSTYQREVHSRLGLTYELLSDEKLEMVDRMKLPTFDWEGKKVARRVTLAVEKGGKVVRVWYPVFPPDQAVEEVREWLQMGKGGDDFR